jgi:hypothetical protein
MGVLAIPVTPIRATDLLSCSSLTHHSKMPHLPRLRLGLTTMSSTASLVKNMVTLLVSSKKSRKAAEVIQIDGSILEGGGQSPFPPSPFPFPIDRPLPLQSRDRNYMSATADMGSPSKCLGIQLYPLKTSANNECPRKKTYTRPKTTTSIRPTTPN